MQTSVKFGSRSIQLRYIVDVGVQPGNPLSSGYAVVINTVNANASYAVYFDYFADAQELAYAIETLLNVYWKGVQGL